MRISQNGYQTVLKCARMSAGNICPFLEVCRFCRICYACEETPEYPSIKAGDWPVSKSKSPLIVWTDQIGFRITLCLLTHQLKRTGHSITVDAINQNVTMSCFDRMDSRANSTERNHSLIIRLASVRPPRKMPSAALMSPAMIGSSVLGMAVTP